MKKMLSFVGNSLFAGMCLAITLVAGITGVTATCDAARDYNDIITGNFGIKQNEEQTTVE